MSEQSKPVKKDRSCANCGFLEREGLCCHVPGENYGDTTIVSPKFFCYNWRENKRKREE